MPQGTRTQPAVPPPAPVAHLDTSSARNGGRPVGHSQPARPSPRRRPGAGAPPLGRGVGPERPWPKLRDALRPRQSLAAGHRKEHGQLRHRVRHRRAVPYRRRRPAGNAKQGSCPPRPPLPPAHPGAIAPVPDLPVAEVLGLLRDIVSVVSDLVNMAPAPALSEAVPHLEEGLARLAAIADDPRHTSRTDPRKRGRAARSSAAYSREGGRSFPEDAGQKLPPSLSLVRDGPRAPRERSTSDVPRTNLWGLRTGPTSI